MPDLYSFELKATLLLYTPLPLKLWMNENENIVIYKIKDVKLLSCTSNKYLSALRKIIVYVTGVICCTKLCIGCGSLNIQISDFETAI